jgi:hypothetical protein
MAVLMAVSTACTFLQSSPPTPRSQLDAAIAQVRATRSVHVVGVYHADALIADDLDLELADGEVFGTVRHNQDPPAQVIGRDQLVLVRSAAYFAATQTAVIGDRWVAGDGHVGLVVASIDTPGRLADLINNQTRTFKVKARSVTVAGRKATLLVANGLSLWVSQSPARVVRIASQPAQSVFPVSLFDLTLDRYGARIKVPALPAPALDLSLPENGTPTFYVPQESAESLDNCDQAGCTMSATVANLGGMLGRTIATLEVSPDKVTIVGSCQVVLDPIPPGQKETIHCRVNFPVNENVYTTVEFKNV